MSHDVTTIVLWRERDRVPSYCRRIGTAKRHKPVAVNEKIPQPSRKRKDARPSVYVVTELGFDMWPPSFVKGRESLDQNSKHGGMKRNATVRWESLIGGVGKRFRHRDSQANKRLPGGDCRHWRVRAKAHRTIRVRRADRLHPIPRPSPRKDLRTEPHQFKCNLERAAHCLEIQHRLEEPMWRTHRLLSEWIRHDKAKR